MIMPKKIFGREPAWVFAFIASVLLALIQFTNVPTDLAGALNAAVLAGAGFATAATVSAERALPALVGLVQAVFAVSLAYGSPVDETTQTGILALIAAVGAAFVRGNVYAPVDSGGDTARDRLNAAYGNGYQAGQDDMQASVDEVVAETAAKYAGHPQETGTRGLTETMPRVGRDFPGDLDDQR
jgi:hypothetical protein